MRNLQLELETIQFWGWLIRITNKISIFLTKKEEEKDVR